MKKEDYADLLDPKYDTPSLEIKQPTITSDDEQGWASALGTAVVRGGIGIGEMTFNAIAGADEYFDQYVNAEPENDPDNWDLKEWSTGLAKDVEKYKNTFTPATKGAKGTVSGAVESVVTSLGSKIPLAIAGYLAAPLVLGAGAGAGLVGVAGSVGAVGAAFGYLSGSMAFGLAQKNTAVHKYTDLFIKEGYSPEKARGMAETPSNIEAALETGTEVMSDLFTMGIGKIGKLAAKSQIDVAKKTLANMLKHGMYKEGGKVVAQTWMAETAGETLNSIGQLATEKIYGKKRELSEILRDPEFWDNIQDQFGQIAVSSLIFGGLNAGQHIYRNKQTTELLENGTAPKADRVQAARLVEASIREQSDELADRFRDGAIQAIKAGESLDFELEIQKIPTEEEMVAAKARDLVNDETALDEPLDETDPELLPVGSPDRPDASRIGDIEPMGVEAGQTQVGKVGRQVGVRRSEQEATQKEMDFYAQETSDDLRKREAQNAKDEMAFYEQETEHPALSNIYNALRQNAKPDDLLDEVNDIEDPQLRKTAVRLLAKAEGHPLIEKIQEALATGKDWKKVEASVDAEKDVDIKEIAERLLQDAEHPALTQIKEALQQNASPADLVDQAAEIEDVDIRKEALRLLADPALADSPVVDVVETATGDGTKVTQLPQRPEILTQAYVDEKYKKLLAEPIEDEPDNLSNDFDPSNFDEEDILSELDSSDNVNLTKQSLRAHIADQVGDMIETSRYESEYEGRAYEDKIDGWLKTVDGYRREVKPEVDLKEKQNGDRQTEKITETQQEEEVGTEGEEGEVKEPWRKVATKEQLRALEDYEADIKQASEAQVRASDKGDDRAIEIFGRAADSSRNLWHGLANKIKAEYNKNQSSKENIYTISEGTGLKDQKNKMLGAIDEAIAKRPESSTDKIKERPFGNQYHFSTSEDNFVTISKKDNKWEVISKDDTKGNFNLKEAKEYARALLRGEVTQQGEVTFTDGNYTMIIPNSVYNLNKFRKKVKTSTGVRFSRKTVKQKRGSMKRMVQKKVDQVVRKLKFDNAPPITAVQSESELPARLLQRLKSENAKGEVGAIYDVDTQQIFIISDNVHDSTEVHTLVLHEVAGHHGIRGVLGKRLDKTLDEVFAHFGKDEFGKIAKDYKLDLTKQEDQRIAAEEMLASSQEYDQKHQKFIKRIYAQIRDLLRRIGVVKKMTDNDIALLLSKSMKFAQKGKRKLAVGKTAFSKQEIVEHAKAFYSRLQESVKSLPPSMKAQKVISFLKKKLKDTNEERPYQEMQAVGLKEWLAAKGPNAQVTRQELADFVKANTVEVEDVVLGSSDEQTVATAARETFDSEFGRGNEFWDDWLYATVELEQEVTWNDPSHRAWYYLEHDKVQYLANEEGDVENAKVQFDEDFEGLEFDSIFDEGTIGWFKDEAYKDQKYDYETAEEARRKETGKTGSATHFSAYQEPGAVEGSYREMFVTAPGKFEEYYNEKWLDNLGVPFGELSDSNQKHIKSRYKNRAGDKAVTDWKDGHDAYSDIKNPIVRIRFNEVEGPSGERILRIEEMQGPKPDNQKKMPQHLRDNIYQLGIKRVLAYAKENGFDGVALVTKPKMTPGETQADRYSLDKQVDEITVSKWKAGAYAVKGYRGHADHNLEPVFNKDNIAEADLESYIGKDLSKQAIERLKENEDTSFTGDALKISATGLKQLYDTTLPKMFEAYGKGKMRDGVIPITSKTPESYPMFSRKDQDAITYTNNGDVIPLSERFNKASDDIRFSRKKTPIKKKETIGKSLFPETQKKVEEHRGRKKGTVKEKFTTFATDFVAQSSKKWKDLDYKTHAEAGDYFRVYNSSDEFSKAVADQQVMKYVKDMKPEEYDVFRQLMAFRDVKMQIEKDKAKKPEDRKMDLTKPLAFHKNEQELDADIAHFESQITPEIKKSIDRRTKFMKDLRNTAIRVGTLDEQFKDDDNYFHREVLRYMDENPKTGVSPSTMVSKQKSRTGASSPFNTEFIEAEYAVIARMVQNIKAKEVLDRTKSDFDIAKAARKKMKDEGLSKKEVIPVDKDGNQTHTWWKPKDKTAWHKVLTITDSQIQKVTDGIIGIEDIKTGEALAKGRDEEWLIPTDIAKTLDQLKEFKQEDLLSRIGETTLNRWKQWILLNPYRFFKYNFNNMSGDLDITFAAYPDIITKYSKQAAKDLWLDFKGKSSPELQAELFDTMEHAVIASGMTASDIPDYSEQMRMNKHIDALIPGDSKFGLKAATGKLRNSWLLAKDLSTFRENVLRLAAFRYFKDNFAEGRTQVLGVSKESELNQLKVLDEKAARLARDLLGDYGNLTQTSEWLRRKMIPFWSWQSINAPRYYRLFKNLRHDELQTGKKGELRAVGALSWKAGKVAVRTAMLFTMVSAWNAGMFPEEEEELGESGRKQLHIILGRRDDGTIISVRFQGALSDALGWFALEDIDNDMKRLMTGKDTLADKVNDAINAPLTRLYQGSRPLLKTVVEAGLGVSTYPEFTSPRPVRDKVRHILRTFSLDKIYDQLAGKPIAGGNHMEQLGKDLMNVFAYSTDPGITAYYDTRKLASEFMEKETGQERPTVVPTSKSNALYYYKQALRFGDVKAAEKYLKKYYDLGGKRSGIKISLKAIHPLGGVPKRYRTKFKRSMDEGEKFRYQKALEFYKKAYRTKR